MHGQGGRFAQSYKQCHMIHNDDGVLCAYYLYVQDGGEGSVPPDSLQLSSQSLALLPPLLHLSPQSVQLGLPWETTLSLESQTNQLRNTHTHTMFISLLLLLLLAPSKPLHSASKRRGKKQNIEYSAQRLPNPQLCTHLHIKVGGL